MSVQINNVVIPFIQIPGDFEYHGFYEDDDEDVDFDDVDYEDYEDYEDENDEDDEIY
jgi:hypothetical protein